LHAAAIAVTANNGTDAPTYRSYLGAYLHCA